MERLVFLLPVGHLLDLLVDVLDGRGDVVELSHGPAADTSSET
jgi:hypothetical protein